MASEQYCEYLNSDAWRRKRNERLAISNYACAACGSKKSVHVHHLAYARIFNEEMADLLPLCHLHHKAAEEMVDRGTLKRSGNVLHLAAETIRLVCPRTKKGERHQKKTTGGIETRNVTQDQLLESLWFSDALRLSIREFKRTIKGRFRGDPRLCRVMANAIALYHRRPITL